MGKLRGLVYRSYISVEIKCMHWNRYFCASPPHTHCPCSLAHQGWAHGWLRGRLTVWALKRWPSVGHQSWALCSRVWTISFSIWHHGFNLQGCLFHAPQWDLLSWSFHLTKAHFQSQQESDKKVATSGLKGTLGTMWMPPPSFTDMKTESWTEGPSCPRSHR